MTRSRADRRNAPPMSSSDAWLDATAQAELVARGDASPARARRRRDRAHRGAEPRAQRGDPRALRARPRRSARGRRPLPDGAVARRAVPREGRGVPHRRRPVPLRHAAAASACSGPSPTTRGSRRASARPGFVFVGKTNTPELATSVTTEPLAYGADAQPVGPHALARRFERRLRGRGRGRAWSPVAHGNDMGGSIRFPASMCGIVGLKPTRARTTLGPDFGEYWGPLTHEHVLTRSVRDTALVLDAIAGRGPGDPYTAPPPRAPVPRRGRRAAGRLRIGLRTRRRDGDRERTRLRARRSSAPAGSSSRSATTSRRSTSPRSTTPVDDAFGIVMMRRGRARPRALERAHRRRRSPPTTSSPATCFLAQIGAQRDRRRRTPARSSGCRRGRAASRRGGTTTTCSSRRRARSRRCALGELAPDEPRPDGRARGWARS